MPAILADLLSCGAQRVWASACAIIQWHDSAALSELARHLPEIERRTAGLELGGAFIPNSEHVKQALRVLRAQRDGQGPCSVYPVYLFYQPDKEAQAGRVRLLSADEPPDWNMTYRCQGTVCGSEYGVEQGEYHDMWWQWRQG